MMVLQEIINNYRATGELSHEEIVFLLGLEKPDEVGGLLALANEVREKHLGPDVHLRGGIIEFPITASAAAYTAASATATGN